jgi:hypothetical protein
MKYFQTKTATSATTAALRTYCRLYFFTVSNRIKYSIVLLKETSRLEFEIDLRRQADITLWVQFLYVCLYFIGLNIAGQISVSIAIARLKRIYFYNGACGYVPEVQ